MHTGHDQERTSPPRPSSCVTHAFHIDPRNTNDRTSIRRRKRRSIHLDTRLSTTLALLQRLRFSTPMKSPHEIQNRSTTKESVVASPLTHIHIPIHTEGERERERKKRQSKPPPTLLQSHHSTNSMHTPNIRTLHHHANRRRMEPVWLPHDDSVDDSHSASMSSANHIALDDPHAIAPTAARSARGAALGCFLLHGFTAFSLAGSPAKLQPLPIDTARRTCSGTNSQTHQRSPPTTTTLKKRKKKKKNTNTLLDRTGW